MSVCISSNNGFMKSTTATFAFAFLIRSYYWQGWLAFFPLLSPFRLFNTNSLFSKDPRTKKRKFPYRLLNNRFSCQWLHIRNTRDTDIFLKTHLTAASLQLRDSDFFVSNLGLKHLPCLNTVRGTRRGSQWFLTWGDTAKSRGRITL